MNIFSFVRLSWVALAMLICGLTSHVNAQMIRTVSLSTQPVPGLGNNIEMTMFYASPVINKHNEVAFGAFFVGPGVGMQNDHGVFRESSGIGLGMIARAGSPAPGAGPGANFESFDPPLINDNGDSAFHATLAGMGVTGISNTGIFREGVAGGVNLVARKGNTAPTMAINVDYAGFRQLQFSQLGQTAFLADLAGPGVNTLNDLGVFREVAAGPGVTVVARTSGFATSAGPGVFFSDFPTLLLSDSGQIAFLAELDGPNVDSTNNEGIFKEAPNGALDLVARSGDLAIGSGVFFESLRSPTLNDSDQMAFAADLTGVGVNETNDQAIFLAMAGATPNVAYRTGNPTPGTNSGVNFLFFGKPRLNDLGKIAFVAGLTGTDVDESNDLAIFREPLTGSLELIARTGEPAPGTNANFATFSKPSYNNEGRVAFVGFLQGDDVDSSNDVGIFAENSVGQLKLIAREGDLLDVSDNPAAPDPRTVSDGSFGSLEDEEVEISGFNHLGNLVFSAQFDDGSEGVFLASTTLILGDMNGDGLVNLLDVAPFVDALSNGNFVAEGDINQDGALNLTDVAPFIDLLAG